MSAPPIERICELNVNLSSPIEIEEALYLVGQNGDIFKLKDGQLKVIKEEYFILWRYKYNSQQALSLRAIIIFVFFLERISLRWPTFWISYGPNRLRI